MITKRENVIRAITHKTCEFLPVAFDMKSINVPLIADNVARNSVRDGRPKVEPDPNGTLDVFGVRWIWVPTVRGAMEDPNQPHLLEDVCDWREVLDFPDPDSWDWAGEVEANREYMNDPNVLYKSTIFTGFFERLISFMGFENAAVAMIDDECEDDLIALFDRLCDLYCCYVKNYKKYFDIELIEIHDDWGSQLAPFFSEETLRKIILPALKKFADYSHKLGLFVELHSCGKVDSFVPCMIEAGVDLWMAQEINDKVAVHRQYGDRFIVETELPELGVDANQEAMEAAAREYVDTFVGPNNTSFISIYSFGPNNPREFLPIVQKMATEKLAGILASQ